MAAKFTIEQNDNGFKIMEDDLCYEAGIATREQAEATIKELEQDDTLADVLGAAMDLAVDHVQKIRPDLDVEEVKSLIAEMLRG